MGNLKENILNKIRAHDLTMKPKLHFTLRLVAFGVLAVLIFVTSTFIFNFIFFTIRVSEHFELLGYGFRGVVVFVTLFPWGLLLVDVFLVLLLERVLRKFRFGYRSPILYLFLGLLALGAAIGLAVDRDTPVNDILMRRAHEHMLPRPINGFYENAHRPFPAEFEHMRMKAL